MVLARFSEPHGHVISHAALNRGGRERNLDIARGCYWDEVHIVDGPVHRLGFGWGEGRAGRASLALPNWAMSWNSSARLSTPRTDTASSSPSSCRFCWAPRHCSTPSRAFFTATSLPVLIASPEWKRVQQNSRL